MKIDRTKLKKCSSEVPPDCKALIDKLKYCSHDELLEELSKVETWNCGKSDLHHWVDVLDIFDHVLEISCEKTKENQWCLPCDEPHWANQKKLLLAVLQFTVLLIEHSFSRNCYNSMEHLTTLLSSSDMNVVLAVLNLLYAFSKRLNFIARLNTEKRQSLLLRLLYLAESWGGKLNGFGLAECCEDLDITAYPSSASTLHFEYYAENVDDKSHKKTSNTVIAIHIDNVDKISDKSPSRIMEEIIEKYAVPEDKQMQLFTHIRLAHSFSDYPKRILCVQARLQAISILVYSNEMPDTVNSFLYNGLIEELVDVLELQNHNLKVLKAAALRTLTSIIHLDKNPKISAIVDTTGAASYHEMLRVLVRRCIQSIIDPDSESFPLPFTDALFSILYYLASYESGRDVLVSCGMVEVLLKVIHWPNTETDYINLVTRAFIVIDFITNKNMQAFHAHDGLASFIKRLEVIEDGTYKKLKKLLRKPHCKQNDTLKTSIYSKYKPPFLTDQEFNHLIFEAADGFLFVIDYYTGHIIYVSDTIVLVLNQFQADWFNVNILDLIHIDDVEVIWEQLSTQEAPNAERILGFKTSMRTAAMGSRRDFSCRMKIGNSKPYAYAVVHCSGYIKNVQNEPLVSRDARGSSRCFVAIGRLQATNMATDSDMASYPSNTLISQNNMKRKLPLVDQRSFHHQQAKTDPDYSFPSYSQSWIYLPVVPWSHHLGDAGQADYSQAWVEYYYSLGMFREAEMIEQQSRGNQGGQAGNPVSTSAVPIYNPYITPQVTTRAIQPAPAVTPAAARPYPAPGQQPQPAQVPYGQPAPYPGYNYAAAYDPQQ